MLLPRALIITILVLTCAASMQAQQRSKTLQGRVVAYATPDVIVPAHSTVPKSQILVVRVSGPGKFKNKLIAIVAEYFSEKSPVPEMVSKGGEWRFRGARRPDCDLVLAIRAQPPGKPDAEDTWLIQLAPVTIVDASFSEAMIRRRMQCYAFESAEKLNRSPRRLPKRQHPPATTPTPEASTSDRDVP